MSITGKAKVEALAKRLEDGQKLLDEDLLFLAKRAVYRFTFTWSNQRPECAGMSTCKAVTQQYWLNWSDVKNRYTRMFTLQHWEPYLREAVKGHPLEEYFLESLEHGLNHQGADSYLGDNWPSKEERLQQCVEMGWI